MPVNSQILRLIDANANRAREALRVIEDYARFVLNDQASSSELKEIRHALAGALGESLGQAILHRDTPGDVGRENKTETEFSRADLAAVVVAAGKRLGEALRCLEEYFKTIDVQSAAKIEAVRYQFYDIECRLAFSLRPGTRFADVRLCVLITENLCKGSWLETAEQAILGGADCLQLREKQLDAGELLCRAKEFVELCRKYDVISIINDRADIALLSNADGVHVGQSDLPAKAARQIVGAEKIVGVSTHCVEQALQAVRDGADYIGAGPVFPSQTKSRDSLAGLDYLRQLVGRVRIPAVAISGITAANVDEVTATGVHAVAVTASVISCDHPRAATEQLKAKLSPSTAVVTD